MSYGLRCRKQADECNNQTSRKKLCRTKLLLFLLEYRCPICVSAVKDHGDESKRRDQNPIGPRIPPQQRCKHQQHNV